MFNIFILNRGTLFFSKLNLKLNPNRGKKVSKDFFVVVVAAENQGSRYDWRLIT